MIRPILAPSSERCSTNNFYRKDLASSVEKVDLDSFNKQIHINKVHLQNQIGTGAVGHDNSANNLFWMTTNQRDYGGLGKNCLYVICLIAIQYFSKFNIVIKLISLSTALIMKVNIAIELKHLARQCQAVESTTN